MLCFIGFLAKLRCLVLVHFHVQIGLDATSSQLFGIIVEKTCNFFPFLEGLGKVHAMKNCTAILLA